MIIVWTSAHFMFAVEMFSKTGISIIATQRAFRGHFMLSQNDAVHD